MKDPRKLAKDAAVAAVWLPRDQLERWERNPRKHTERSLAATRMSIERFGFVAPVIVWKEGDRMVAGHGRLKSFDALREQMGPDWAPKHAPGPGLVPVRFMSFESEKEANDYAIVDNRTTELSDWDYDALAAVVEDFDSLEDTLVAMALWSEEELASMREPESHGAFEPAQEREAPQPSDEIPDVVPAVTKNGEVVLLGRHRLTCMDCVSFMKTLPENSVDAIVTDPPYGLSPDGRARTWDDIEKLREAGEAGPRSGFMGSEWDAGVPGITWARECFRVLKPGGYIIAFASTRTVHRLAVSVEDAGFEIRDMVSWLYWQGFPKNHDISKAIDEIRGEKRDVVGKKRSGIAVPGEKGRHTIGGSRSVEIDVTVPVSQDAKRWAGWGTALKPSQEPAVFARKPCEEDTVAGNVLKWNTGGINIEGCRYPYNDPDSGWPGPMEEWSWEGDQGWRDKFVGGTESRTPGVVFPPAPGGRWPGNIYYCPKPSRNEKEAGTDQLPGRQGGVPAGPAGMMANQDPGHTVGNFHPTVKPVRLMRWLVRLVTPPGGTVLEPFAGSGTTLLAAEAEGVSCVAVEREPAYCDIIRARFTAHNKEEPAAAGSSGGDSD